jgi:hypothetical protein
MLTRNKFLLASTLQFANHKTTHPQTHGKTARPQARAGHPPALAGRRPENEDHTTHTPNKGAVSHDNPHQKSKTRTTKQWPLLHRKEVIQPHLPVRLPCYDLVPITSPTFDRSPRKTDRPRASGVADFHDLTGGVYKARERIHRGVADPRLLATPPSRSRVAGSDPN